MHLEMDIFDFDIPARGYIPGGGRIGGGRIGGGSGRQWPSGIGGNRGGQGWNNGNNDNGLNGLNGNNGLNGLNGNNGLNGLNGNNGLNGLNGNNGLNGLNGLNGNGGCGPYGCGQNRHYLGRWILIMLKYFYATCTFLLMKIQKFEIVCI